MNRIEKLFSNKDKKVLSVYFTAGYPGLNDTLSLIKALDKAGADMIEIGMPFSDPVADGPVIQRSSEIALRNGMNLKLLFSQIEKVRQFTDMPLLIMGYFNPFLRFGMDRFIGRCTETGVDGTIIPDLPVDEYLGSYASAFGKAGLCNTFLITPQTPDDRIRYLDSISHGFLYMVSTSSTTGVREGFDGKQVSYFKRIKEMKLKTPILTGFGISDRATFEQAAGFTNGAIIGSAFIKALDGEGSLEEKAMKFIRSVRAQDLQSPGLMV